MCFYGSKRVKTEVVNSQRPTANGQQPTAKSQYEVVKKNLADCRLTAPVSGIIGKKQVGAGETAMPSQAVVTILDISSVKVKVSIPEAEISGITASTPSTFSVEAAQNIVHLLPSVSPWVTVSLSPMASTKVSAW